MCALGVTFSTEIWYHPRIMIIAQISDSHITATGETREARLADLETAIADINGLEPSPDIVIHTGDLTHDHEREEYELVIERLDRLDMPVYYIPGNRDNRSIMRELFGTRFPLEEGSQFFSYAIEDFPVRLIGIDTTSDKSGLGRFCDERADFLNQALAAEPQKPTLLCIHHPPYGVPQSRADFEFEDRAEVARLEEMLRAYPGEVRLIAGHVHRNTNHQIGEIDVSTMPSVALDLRGKSDALCNEGVVQYHIHEFGPDGKFKTRLRNVEAAGDIAVEATEMRFAE